MPQFVIEREMPGVGQLGQDDLQGASRKGGVQRSSSRHSTEPGGLDVLHFASVAKLLTNETRKANDRNFESSDTGARARNRK